MTTTRTPEERNALRKKRISRTIKRQHRDPEWRRRWEIGNSVGKQRAKIHREARSAFRAQLSVEERRALGIE